MAGATVAIELDEHVVEVSKPSKALFPSGVTKLDLARYMEAVAPALLRHVADRPLNLQRFPDGVAKHGIFQQQVPDYFPDWIGRCETPKEGGTVTHVVAGDAATLVYLANQACVTLHAWLSRCDRLDRPDRLVIDLDPSGGTADDVRAAALMIGAILRDELGAAAVRDGDRLARLPRRRPAPAAGTTTTRCAPSPATSAASRSCASRAG